MTFVFSAPTPERESLDGANRRSACMKSQKNDTERPRIHEQATLRLDGRSRVSESVVHVSKLTRRFGATTKTVLIKHILGLLRAFALDPTAKIKDLSKGQKARAGLLITPAQRPDEGRTVLFSS